MDGDTVHSRDAPDQGHALALHDLDGAHVKEQDLRARGLCGFSRGGGLGREHKGPNLRPEQDPENGQEGDRGKGGQGYHRPYPGGWASPRCRRGRCRRLRCVTGRVGRRRFRTVCIYLPCFASQRGWLCLHRRWRVGIDGRLVGWDGKCIRMVDRHLQVRSQIPGPFVAIARVLGHGLADHGLDFRRDVVHRGRHVRGILHDVGEEDGVWCRLAKGHCAGQSVVKGYAKGVDIGAMVDGIPLGLLGRHVVGGAHDKAGTGDAASPRHLDQAKVHQGDVITAIGIDHDVAGLDVTMNIATAVRIVQRATDLAHDVEDPLCW